MGLNVGSLNLANQKTSVIDVQALAKVKEQILNPNNEKTVDVSKLDLSKFNRVSLGTDLYAARTNGETALQAAKASSDFGLNFSKDFNASIQYLNSQAAQSLFTSKENNGKVIINVENAQKVTEEQVVLASSQIAETNTLNKDRRGSNPFSFYIPSAGHAEAAEETDEIFNEDKNFEDFMLLGANPSFGSINLFA